MQRLTLDVLPGSVPHGDRDTIALPASALRGAASKFNGSTKRCAIAQALALYGCELMSALLDEFIDRPSNACKAATQCCWPRACTGPARSRPLGQREAGAAACRATACLPGMEEGSPSRRSKKK